MTRLLITAGAVLATGLCKSALAAPLPELDRFSYVLGTQTFGAAYQFTQESRLVETAGAILERASQPSIRRMAQMLVDQLCEVMPELKGVSPWHAVGRRRTQDELGQAAFRRIPTDVFRRPAD